MKKKIFTFFTILLLLSFVGCTKNNSKDNDKNNDKMDLNNYSKVENFDCSELNENVKEISNNYFVDNQGNLYKYAFDKVFSKSNKHCIKIDTANKYISGISGGFVYDSNDYEYYLGDINDEKNIFQNHKYYEYEKSREYFIKKSFPNSNLQLFLIASSGIIVENNKIYDVQYGLTNEIQIKEEIKINDSENILNIYEGISYEHFFVETDVSYYSCNKIVTNKEEYEAYADVECKKEFFCDRINELNNSNVKNFLGKIVVMRDNTIYKYTSTINNDLNYNCDK